MKFGNLRLELRFWVLFVGKFDLKYKKLGIDEKIWVLICEIGNLRKEYAV